MSKGLQKLPKEASRLNERLIERLRTAGYLREKAIARAVRRCPRHLFLSDFKLEINGGCRRVNAADPRWSAAAMEAAYQPGAAIGTRQADNSEIWTSSCSSPEIVCWILATLAVTPGCRVLEIGAGTGWNAALLSSMAGASGFVYSLDIQPDVVIEARRHLKRAGIVNCRLETADGRGGFPSQAPFDRIVATVGCRTVFSSWISQLSEGGRIVVPLEMRGLNTPIVWLDKRNGVLSGGFAGHAHFMSMLGERRPRVMDRVPRRKERVSGVWPLPWQKSRDDWDARLGFLLYLHAAEPRSAVVVNGAGWDVSVGLRSSKPRGRALVAPGRLEAYGDRSAVRQLLRHCRRWEQLGMPGLRDYVVEALKTGESLPRSAVGVLNLPGLRLALKRR